MNVCCKNFGKLLLHFFFNFSFFFVLRVSPYDTVQFERYVTFTLRKANLLNGLTNLTATNLEGLMYPKECTEDLRDFQGPVIELRDFVQSVLDDIAAKRGKRHSCVK